MLIYIIELVLPIHYNWVVLKEGYYLKSVVYYSYTFLIKIHQSIHMAYYEHMKLGIIIQKRILILCNRM